MAGSLLWGERTKCHLARRQSNWHIGLLQTIWSMQSAQPRHEDHSKIHSEEWHDAAEEDAVSEPDEFHDAEDDHQASATAPSSAQAPSEQGSASSAKLDQAVHATQSSHAAQPSRTEPLNPQTIAQAGQAAVAAEDQPESDAPEPSSVAPSDPDAGQAAAASEAEVQEPEGVDQAASAPPELTEQQKEVWPDRGRTLDTQASSLSSSDWLLQWELMCPAAGT